MLITNIRIDAQLTLLRNFCVNIILAATAVNRPFLKQRLLNFNNI